MTAAEVELEIDHLHAELQMLGRIEWWLSQQEKSLRARINALRELLEESDTPPRRRPNDSRSRRSCSHDARNPHTS